MYLRYYEYYYNTKTTYLDSVRMQLMRILFRRISIRLGFSIPPNVCGKGVFFPHYGTIIINSAARIGANSLVHTGVVIGATGGSAKAPVIGRNVFIGPGAKIFGDIMVADNCYIGANSVVSKSINQGSAVVVGVPGKIIKTDQTVWWKKNRLLLDNDEA